MPVSISEISEQIEQASGCRVKFKYTFVDGRVFYAGPVSCSLDEVDQLLIDKKAPLELSVKNNDAQEAQQLGLKTAYKDASQSDVYYIYLYEGFNEDDPILSYELYLPVAQDILDLGLTIEQMAVMFNQDVGMVNDVINKWLYLDSNSAEILAYQAVKGGM